MTLFPVITTADVHMLGRKGAVALYTFKIVTLLAAFVLALAAWRNQPLEGLFSMYVMGAVGNLLAFVGGNAVEHMAKKGKTDEPAPAA